MMNTRLAVNMAYLLLAATGLLLAAPLLAQDYEPGHKALQLWNEEGMANAPVAVKVWIYFMMATFVVGLVFVWKRVEARWVVGGVIIALLISGWLLPALGFTLLSGLVALVHLVCWSPALYVLISRRTFVQERSFYAFWCGWVTLVILISFVFDIRDGVIYLMHMLTR